MPQALAAVVIGVASAVGGAVTAVAAIIPGVSALGAMTAGHMAGTFVASLGFTNGLAAGFSALAMTASLASVVSGPPKPKVGNSAGGTQVDFKADPTAPLPMAFGLTGTGGSIVKTAVAGEKNAQLCYLVVLSAGGPIQSIEKFTADDIAITFSREAPTGDLAVAGENPDGSPNNRFSNGNLVMWDRRQLGDTPSPPFHPPAVEGVLPGWSDGHKLSGKAAVWWVLGYEPKTYSSGTPKPLWTIKGVKAYDPRFDSTYPGGAGPQRAGDRSTWVYSENPGVVAISWVLGYYSNGKKVMGVGAPVSGVDLSAYIECANVSDANAWKVGGVVYSSDDKWDVLRTILQAGGAKPMRLGALISCFTSTPKVSLATLTGADVVGEAVITAGRRRRERINAVAPRYRSPDHGYQIVDASQIVVPAYVEFDGAQRTQPIAYGLVQDVAQVGQLAAYDIVDSREFGPISLACKPFWGGLAPGDAITIDEPEFGLIGQKAVIVAREFDRVNGQVLLQLRSETDDKHDYALGRTATPPGTPGLGGVDPSVVPTPEVASWTCTGGLVEGPAGSGKLPAIIVEGAADDPLVQGIIIEYRERLTIGPPATFGEWASGGEHPANTTRVVITSVKPATTYQVRLRYRTVRGIDDVEAALVFPLVTTGSLAVGPFDPDDAVPPGPPTSVTASPTFEHIYLTWTNPADEDLRSIEIWEKTTNVVPNPVTEAATARIDTIGASAPGQRQTYDRGGLANNVTRFYWLRAVDFAGNVSVFSTVASATTREISAADLSGAASTAVPTGLVVSSAIALDTDGSQIAVLSIDWNDNAEATLVGYDVAVQEAAGGFVSFFTSASNYQLQVKANVLYTVKVRSVDGNGRRSAYTANVAHTTAKDTVAPSAPTTLVATAGIGNVFLSWTNPSAADLVAVEIWENTVDNSGSATKVDTVNAAPGAQGRWSRVGLATATSRYFWIKAIDSSGNASGFNAAGGTVATTLKVTGPDVVVNAVFANDIVANITSTNVLNANVLQAASSLPGSLVVGVTGFTLSTMSSTLISANNLAQDPAARINSFTTQILPGKIIIDGATTLSDWRNGGDQTKINGGAIAANSVKANTAVIGMRGIDVSGLKFEHNSPSGGSCAWTSGSISYLADNGTAATAFISSGQTSYGGSTVYIYWVKGSGSLSATTSASTAYGDNNIVLATYGGGLNLVATYGQTVIDGANIKTNSISTNQLGAQIIKASHMDVTDLVAHTITADILTVGTVNTPHVMAGAMSGGTGAANDTTYYGTPGSAQTVLSAGYTSVGGKLLLSFSMYINPITYPTFFGAPTQSTWAGFAFYRDGVLVRRVPAAVAILMPDGGGGYMYLLAGGMVAFSVLDTGAAAGGHSFAVQYEVYSDALTTVTAVGPTMAVLEMKR